MKNSGNINSVLTGVYTKIINVDNDLSNRIVVSKNMQKNKTSLDFFVSDFDISDGFEVLPYLKKGEQLDIVLEPMSNTLAVYTYDFVKLGYIPNILSSLFTKRLDDSSKDNIICKIKKINRKKFTDNKSRIEVRSIINL